MINRKLISDAFNKSNCDLFIRCPEEKYAELLIKELSNLGITWDSNKPDLHTNWDTYKETTVYIIKHNKLESPEFYLMYSNYNDIEDARMYNFGYFELPLEEFIGNQDINKQTWEDLLDF